MKEGALSLRTSHSFEKGNQSSFPGWPQTGHLPASASLEVEITDMHTDFIYGRMYIRLPCSEVLYGTV